MQCKISLNPASPDFHGIQITSTTRMRDLPDYIRMAGIPHEGALHPFTFEGGKFFSIKWKKAHPLYWPDAHKTEVLPGDYLALAQNGGIAHITQDALPQADSEAEG
jgi:hypothetical protein